MDKNEIKKIKQRIKQYEQYCSDDDTQDTTLENISRREAPLTSNDSSKKSIISFGSIISRIFRSIKPYIQELLSSLTYLLRRLKNRNLTNYTCVFILVFCSFCMLFYSVMNVTEWIRYRNELQISYDNISKDTLYVQARQFENLGNKLKVEKMPVSYFTSRIHGIDSLLFFDSSKTADSGQFSGKKSTTDSVLRNTPTYMAIAEEGVGWNWLIDVIHYHHYGRLDKISLFPYQVIMRHGDSLSVEQIHSELDSAYRFFIGSVESPFISFINSQKGNNNWWNVDIESVINEKLNHNNSNRLYNIEITPFPTNRLLERLINDYKDGKKRSINDYYRPVLGYWYDKQCIVMLGCSVEQQSAVVSPQEFGFTNLGRFGAIVAVVCAMVITISLLKRRCRNAIKLSFAISSGVLVICLLALVVIKYDEKQIKLQFRKHYYTEVGESTPPPYCDADSGVVGAMNDNGYFLRKIKVNDDEFSISDF